MRLTHYITNGTLLLTIPTTLLIPQNSFTAPQQQSQPQSPVQEAQIPFTLDDIIHLLDEIETDDFEERYSPYEIERINEFLIQLAREGILPEDFIEEAELEEDIEELLSADSPTIQYANITSADGEFILALPYVENYEEYLQCSWKKKWKKTKKFVKKHKKEIIIGAAVVVVVAVVVTAVVVSGGTAAAAGGAVAGAAGSAGAATLGDSNKTSPSTEENLPQITEVVRNNSDDIKRELSEHDLATIPHSQSLGEQTREYVSHMAHQAYSEAKEYISIIPQALDEVNSVGEKITGFSPPEDLSGSCSENFESVASKGHKYIDKVFKTDFADLYEDGPRFTNRPDHAYAALPPPGGGPSILRNPKRFLHAGDKLDRGGYTKAGRGLMKHGNREGSVFPKPKGTVEEVNMQGRQVLEDILNHPEKKVMEYNHKRFGPVIEIEAPNIGGARFIKDGNEMTGFLEPHWCK